MKSSRAPILFTVLLACSPMKVLSAGLELLEVPIASYRVEYMNPNGGQGQLVSVSFILADGNLWIGRTTCKSGVVNIKPDLCWASSVNNEFVSAVDTAIRRGEKVRICFVLHTPIPDSQQVIAHQGNFSGILRGLSYRGYWVFPVDSNMPVDKILQDPCYKWLRGL